jgi:hypothetical protein
VRGDVTAHYVVRCVGSTEDGVQLWAWRPRYLLEAFESEPLPEREAHERGQEWARSVIATERAIEERRPRAARRRRR